MSLERIQVRGSQRKKHASSLARKMEKQYERGYMTKWKCSTCGWICDPTQGDPEKGITPGTPFEDLPNSWVCSVCASGKEFFEPEARADNDRFIMDEQAQRLLAAGKTMYKERFENVFRVAQHLTSSLNISEVLEMIRDEARATLPQLQEVCLLVMDPEAQFYTRPLHCAVEKQRINCQLCKRGRGAVSSALGRGSSAVCFLPDGRGGVSVADGLPPESFAEIVFPICEGDRPLAVLDAIAAPGSTGLSQKDFMLLKDLVDLASNVIKNARSHW